MSSKILIGDCRTEMSKLIAEGVKVQMCVTSPPYFNLRDYQIDGQLGMEETPEEYVSNLVWVCRLVKELLTDDGVLFLNLGDSYWNNFGGGSSSCTTGNKEALQQKGRHNKAKSETYKIKDLIGIPWRVAFALQADGWWLRQDIIWHKPNPMPESVTDRCTKSHEYIFLLTKSANYYYDADAIKEPATCEGEYRAFNTSKKIARCVNTNPSGNEKPGALPVLISSRNKRSVWTVATKPFSGVNLLADYVGVNGKPYKASPDCPVHGQMLLAGMFDKASNGARPVQLKSHNPDIRGDLFAWLDSSQNAKTSHSHSEASCANAPLQKTENNPDYKTEELRHEYKTHEQTLSRKNHKSELCEGLDCKTDSDSRLCSGIAIDHSTEKNKNAPDGQSLLHDTFSSQTPCHKPHTEPEPLLSVQDHGNGESIESESDSDGGHLKENLSRSSGIEIVSSFSCDDDKPKNCTCQQVFIDHFATFPPALIEPCILAGSRKGDTVLDPFFGSGTTGEVAEKHGREWIGIDLNPKYYELSKRRTAQRCLIT